MSNEQVARQSESLCYYGAERGDPCGKSPSSYGEKVSIGRILGTQTFLFVFWATEEIKSELVLLHLVATTFLVLVIILVIVILELC